MPSWIDFTRKLATLSERQLFFLGGAPRSGTTWLQQICDSHPDACCMGEGLFLQQLADPIKRVLRERTQALQTKNKNIFAHTGGYPVPSADHAEHLLATGILLALDQQCSGGNPKAIGEKTPENVFLFMRLADLFPNAKFIAIARDPRDVLSSAWHFFQKNASQDDSAKMAFLQSAFPSLNEGARVMMAFGQQHPDRYLEVTYERLLSQPDETVTRIFRFLGLSDEAELIRQTVASTSFTAATKGRDVGQGSFFRAGASGTWQSTFTPDMNALILHELGWMFTHFGWSA